MDLQRLLKRIKFTGSIDKLDEDLLKELSISFAASIPYETLDIFGGEKRILDLPLMFEKMVTKNRGGLCLELNALLHWTLSQVGFDVKMCMAYTRVQGLDNFEKLCDHMVLLVTLENGTVWLADVGFRNCFVVPLNMGKLSEEQCQPSGIFMITKCRDFYIVEKKKPRFIFADGQNLDMSPTPVFQGISNSNKFRTSPDWTAVFSFRTEAKALSEFHTAFAYVQDSHLYATQNSCAALQDRNCRIYLAGHTLVEKWFIEPGTLEVRIRILENDEITEVLKNKFGIALDFVLQPKAWIHWSVL